MSNLVLGLDIGITSVGYGVIDLDSNELVDYGVRLFKEGTAANNEKRRATRGRRRLSSRRTTRLEDMKKLLKKYQLLEESYVPEKDVYEIRCKGLTEKLTKRELCAAILHLTKHRGSVIETVDDNEENAKETEKLKGLLSANSRLVANGKFVCQIQLERLQQNQKVRGQENNFKTKDYEAELLHLLEVQELDKEFIEKANRIMTRRRAYYEGPGSEKSPTPYGRFIEVDGHIEVIDLIEKMRGKCSVYPDQGRAPKLSVSAELFNLLNDFNNLSIKGEKLSKEDKIELLSIVNKKGKIDLKQIAKSLVVEESEISGYRIDTKGKALFTELKGYKKLQKIFTHQNVQISLKDYVMLDEIVEILTKQKGIEERIQSLSKLPYDLLPDLIHALANEGGFSTYHSLSYKAIYELNKELFETSLNQMQLLHQMHLFGKNRVSYKGKANIEADDTAILSPVTKRAQREAFKVVNALRKTYGEFESIVIEVAREKNSDERRKSISERQKFYKNQNDIVDNLLKEKGYDPNKINAKTKTKIRLYEMQEGKSAYTLQPLDLHRIIKDPTYTEIDHVIPISISLDDSLNNKVLILRSENQAKGNLTPVDAYNKGKFADYDCTLSKYIDYVTKSKLYNRKKKSNLLYSKDITKFTNIKEFINRNLVDTSYACRVVLNTLTDYFKDNDINTKVHTINGSLTSKFRQQVNMAKSRDEDYLHHAIDALIVASIKKLGLLRGYLAKYNLNELYDEDTGEVKEIEGEEAFYNEKHLSFISNLKTLHFQSHLYYLGVMKKDVMYYPPIKISHKIDTKPNRQIADETIYSTRTLDNQEFIIGKYKDIYDPKFKHLTNDILNNNDSKYLMALHDPQTFAILKEVIMNHFEMYKDSTKHYKQKKDKKGITYELVGENPLYLYREEHGPIRKYSKKGNGPVITVLKYKDGALGSHVDISHNYETKDKRVILKQISPYRTDFYLCSDGKYRFVTVRYKDVRYYKESETYKIDESWYESEKVRKGILEDAQFVCSLHRDELIGIVKKEGQKYIYDASTEGEGETLYHNGNRSEILKFTATNNDLKDMIEVKPIYCYTQKRLMPTVGTFMKIVKYTTDVLGNLYEVKENVLKLEFK